MYITTALNVFVLVMDVKLQIERPLSFFLGAVCLRGVLLPVLALFHPLVGWLFRSPEAILQGIFRLGFALAVVVTIGALAGQAYIPSYLSTFRFTELPPLPENWSNVPENPAGLAICSNRYEHLSVIELLGLAFGGYDINRDSGVFSRQMDYFFGPNAQGISYEVIELEPDIPLLIYNVSGTIVFAFRGFATGPELAVQVERLASLWVVPFFLEELPMYSKMVDLYLSSTTAYAHLFGWHWFSPRSASNDLLQKAAAVYDTMGISADTPVLFVGVNSGGTIAKRLALLKNRRAISFLSLPIDVDEFDNRYNISDTALQWVTSVINTDGLFSGEDPGFSENFALIGDPDAVGNDKVYESFCNLAEICGHNAQFGEYCKTAIGEDQLTAIRAYLGRSGGNSTADNTGIG
jgi:hypothetical protein